MIRVYNYPKQVDIGHNHKTVTMEPPTPPQWSYHHPYQFLVKKKHSV
jgi:hypothetical protein